MEKKFGQFLEGLIPVKSGVKVLVASSGGMDSVVLTHLFLQTNCELGIAHCNYGLRGEASDEDEAFVVQMAQQHGLPCHVKQFETERIATERGVSIQMAARELRYEWFDELMEAHGYDYLATAHHQNDQVETMILNLARGTGVAGLTGIPVRRDRIIRPLLCANRVEINAYAKEEALFWREDLSNQETKYDRNLLRHEVVPVLEKLNPRVTQAMDKTASYIKQVMEVYEAEMKAVGEHAVELEGQDIIVQLDRIQRYREAFISYFLLSHHFNSSQVESIVRSLDETGKLFFSSSHQLNIDRGRLLLTPREEVQLDLTFDQLPEEIDTPWYRLTFRAFPAERYLVPSDPAMATFDLDRVTLPMQVKTWQEGDRFRPLGMTGTKKVSDLMIDRKIPLNLKKRQLLLFFQSEVAWVIGEQISDKFKITGQTKRILEIKIIPHV